LEVSKEKEKTDSKGKKKYILWESSSAKFSWGKTSTQAE
jgi:hypothetical protein